MYYLRTIQGERISWDGKFTAFFEHATSFDNEVEAYNFYTGIRDKRNEEEDDYTYEYIEVVKIFTFKGW